MSCENCKVRQEETNLSAYYRWGTAKIEFRGCDKHLREIFDFLNFWQNAVREGKVGILMHPESWENLFNCIRKSRVNLEGNFWAALQEIERQISKQVAKGT